MSNKNKQMAEKVAQVVFSGQPSPIVNANEKRQVSGNGKATFKTATAAANAAREARDEAKKILENCQHFYSIVIGKVNRDIQNTQELIEALKRYDRNLRLYIIMSWAAAGAVIGALIFS